jgi:hypothetical protein
LVRGGAFLYSPAQFIRIPFYARKDIYIGFFGICRGMTPDFSQRPIYCSKLLTILEWLTSTPKQGILTRRNKARALEQSFLKVQGIRHCEAVFAKAIPRYGQLIASTGKERLSLKKLSLRGAKRRGSPPHGLDCFTAGKNTGGSQ